MIFQENAAPQFGNTGIVKTIKSFFEYYDKLLLRFSLKYDLHL